MDYTGTNLLTSSTVIERVVLFYLASDYYLHKYIRYISNTLKGFIIYTYTYLSNSISSKNHGSIQERDSLSLYRCIRKALRGRVTRLSQEKGLDTHRVRERWLREEKREDSVSRTERT